jgi:hypothetical protein
MNKAQEKLMVSFVRMGPLPAWMLNRVEFEAAEQMLASGKLETYAGYNGDKMYKISGDFIEESARINEEVSIYGKYDDDSWEGVSGDQE